MEFIVFAFTRRTLNCISAKRRENDAPALLALWPPPAEDLILVIPPEHKEVFGHDPFKPNVIENPYSFTTHMLLSMHVHFLIITYIHISCIFFRTSIPTSKCTNNSVLIYI
jgi:hypothetical protein